MSAFFRHPKLVGLTFLLATCSILYELTIAHTMSMLAANTVVWYSITIGLYLVGMGVGALVAGKLPKTFDRRRSLAGVELTLCALGAASVAILHFAHMTYAYNSLEDQPSSTMLFFGSAFVLTLLVGVLTGMELPLLIGWAKEEDIRAGTTNGTPAVSLILGYDYFGSLVGALIFPLYLLTHFEMITIAFGVAFINLIAAIGLISTSFRKSAISYAQAAIGLLAAAVLANSCLKNSEIGQYFVQKYYHSKVHLLPME